MILLQGLVQYPMPSFFICRIAARQINSSVHSIVVGAFDFASTKSGLWFPQTSN